MTTEITYHSNGKVYEVIHRDDNGKRHGLCEGWRVNGTQKYRWNYEHGKRHGLSERWRVNGTQEHRNNWEHGKLHGLSECWHDNGTQRYRNNYEHGKRIPSETAELQERLARAEKELATVKAKLGAIGKLIH